MVFLRKPSMAYNPTSFFLFLVKNELEYKIKIATNKIKIIDDTPNMKLIVSDNSMLSWIFFAILQGSERIINNHAEDERNKIDKIIIEVTFNIFPC